MANGQWSPSSPTCDRKPIIHHSGIPYNQVITQRWLVGGLCLLEVVLSKPDFGPGCWPYHSWHFYGYMAATSGSTAISTKALNVYMCIVFFSPMAQRWIVKIEAPPNGVTFLGTIFNSNAKFRCDSGFNLTGCSSA